MNTYVFTVCTLFVGAAGDAGDERVELKEIGVTLPANVQSIKYQQRQAFEQKTLGYSVSYGNKMCAISLIVYDHGKKNIPNGKDNALVRDQLQRSVEDLKSAATRGLYKNLQPLKGPPLPEAAAEAFATAGYSFDIEGGRCKSYILLVGRQQHFLKVRITQFTVDRKTNDEEIHAFLNILAKAVTAK
jgi:hypothetical protein